MPKQTPFKTMTKAQQEAYRAALPKPAPKVKPEAEVRQAQSARAKRDADPKDGLAWQLKKRRLTRPQVFEGMHYRDLFRKLAPGGAIKSNFPDGAGIGAGGGGGLPLNTYDGDAAAKLELFVINSLVLGNQPEMITVMEGVCGHGHTVRYLAGGDQLKAAQLEAVLRVALDLMVENRRAKEAAKTSQARAA